jgi:hypothetical protein
MVFRGRYHPAPGWDGLCRRDDRLQFVATADSFKVDRGKNIGGLQLARRSSPVVVDESGNMAYMQRSRLLKQDEFKRVSNCGPDG